MQALESLSAYDTLSIVQARGDWRGAVSRAVVPGSIARCACTWCWALLTSVIVLVMPLEINGFSVWLAFFRHIPGFNVIRDPTRIVFVYELAFVLAAALLLTGLRWTAVLSCGHLPSVPVFRGDRFTSGPTRLRAPGVAFPSLGGSADCRRSWMPVFSM